MRVEINTLFLDLAQSCKGKHLKSTGICQHRLIPYRKLADTAHIVNHIIPRTHMKVIGVAQHDLCMDLLKIPGRYRTLDCTDRTNIHKYRCLHRTMNRLQSGTLRHAILT